MIRKFAAALLVLLLAVSAAPPAAAGTTSSNAVGRLTSTTACQDIVFLGVRGSGEKSTDGTWGMGKRVTAVYDSFLGNVQNKRIAATGIDYAASDVPVGPSLTLWGATAWEGYFYSIDGGVHTTEATLINRSNKCPDERYVLAGYSQGAMVIHRLMFDLSRAPLGGVIDKILPKISAVATIGDGDRVALDDVVELGSAPSDGYGFGVGLAGFPSGGSFVATDSHVSSIGHGLNSRWFEVCDYGDLVCDYGRALTSGPFTTNLIAGVMYGRKVHTTDYAKGNPAVIEAGRQLALESMKTKHYALTLRIVAEPVSRQYSAAGYQAPYHVLVKNTGTEKFWAGMMTGECSISTETWGTTGQPPKDGPYVSPGEEWAWDCWHPLTASDSSQGYFTASGAVFASSDFGDVANTVVIPTQTVSSKVSVPVQMLSLKMVGEAQTRHDTIWTITLLNSGNETVSTQPLTSSLCGSVPLPSDTLSPGQSVTVTCTSTVTEEYLDGSMNIIDNFVSETAYGSDGQPYSASASANVEAPK